MPSTAILIRLAAGAASAAAMLAAATASVSPLAVTALVWLLVLPLGLFTAAVWSAEAREGRLRR